MNKINGKSEIDLLKEIEKLREELKEKEEEIKYLKDVIETKKRINRSLRGY